MNLTSLLNRLYDRSPEVHIFIIEHLKPFKLDRNEYFLKVGDTSKRIYFIEQGIAREFYTDSCGVDHTTKFLNENQWLFQQNSLIHDEPSIRNLQATEPTHGKYLSKKALETLISNFPAIIYPELVKAMSVHSKLSEAKLELNCLKKIVDRLTSFEETQPTVARRISVGMTASYLNVSREELSRIRCQRAKRTI